MVVQVVIDQNPVLLALVDLVGVVEMDILMEAKQEVLVELMVILVALGLLVNLLMLLSLVEEAVVLVVLVNLLVLLIVEKQWVMEV
jgi:hypothetical protein